MPPKKKPNTTPHYSVGDRVTVTLHTGQFVDATIRASKFDYGHDHTALLEPWRLHPPTSRGF